MDTNQLAKSPVKPPVELVECGRASDLTRGFAYQIAFEWGVAPFNTTYP